MSMGNYAFVEYGLVLNGLKAIPDELLEELSENDIVEYQFSYTGGVIPIDDNGHPRWSEEKMFDDETVYYISAHKFPNLFRQSYKDMDALVRELTRSYNLARKEDDRLPKLTRKEIRDNIRYIAGTYFG